MVDAASARLLSISRVEPGDMLVFEDAAGPFAARAKAILGRRVVVAVRSQPGSLTVLSNPLHSVQYLGRDHTAMISSEMARSGVESRGFHRIVCLGRPDLSGRSHLAMTLKEWKNYLAPGGRIVVEMFHDHGSPSEHWKVTEAAYRASTKSTGFELEQINGIERDEVFSTGPGDVYAYTMSLKQTAHLIRPLDRKRARHLIKRSQILQARLKLARQPQAIEDMVENLITARSCNRLFATFRLG
ncbi:hypothetical protein KCU95_g3196, partial [Aureobasidium melanogenum]